MKTKTLKQLAMLAALGAGGRALLQSESVQGQELVQDNPWLTTVALGGGSYLLRKKSKIASAALIVLAGAELYDNFDAITGKGEEAQKEPTQDSGAVFDPVLAPPPQVVFVRDAGGVYGARYDAGALANATPDAGNLYSPAPDAGAVYGREHALMGRPIV